MSTSIGSPKKIKIVDYYKHQKRQQCIMYVYIYVYQQVQCRLLNMSTYGFNTVPLVDQQKVAPLHS